VFCGLFVLQVRVVLQLLAFAAMVQEVGDADKVPVGGYGIQILPFQEVPPAQLEVTVT
jgi:hypothetical protein